MTDLQSSDDAKRQQFIAQLPWFLNGSLPADAQAWMEEFLRSSAWAEAAVARERVFLASIAAPEPADADLGLRTLLARVQAPGAERSTPRIRWTLALSEWFAMPRLAGAMAALVVAQAGVIGWMAIGSERDSVDMRSTPVSEVRTLRVSFAPDVSESRLRSTLQAAGARVVGGPTQLGEYWLASDIRSLDEMKASLLASGLTRSIEVDLAGPHGR